MNIWFPFTLTYFLKRKKLTYFYFMKTNNFEHSLYNTIFSIIASNEWTNTIYVEEHKLIANRLKISKILQKSICQMLYHSLRNCKPMTWQISSCYVKVNAFYYIIMEIKSVRCLCIEKIGVWCCCCCSLLFNLEPSDVFLERELLNNEDRGCDFQQEITMTRKE